MIKIMEKGSEMSLFLKKYKFFETIPDIRCKINNSNK